MQNKFSPYSSNSTTLEFRYTHDDRDHVRIDLLVWHYWFYIQWLTYSYLRYRCGRRCCCRRCCAPSTAVVCSFQACVAGPHVHVLDTLLFVVRLVCIVPTRLGVEDLDGSSGLGYAISALRFLDPPLISNEDDSLTN